MKKVKYVLILIISFSLYNQALAQKKDTFEEQKKAFEKSLEEQNQSFEQTKSDQGQKYRAFKDKLNDAYGDYLKKTWKKDQTTPGQPQDNTPKPQETPQDLTANQPRQEVTLDVIKPQDLPQGNIPENKIPTIEKIPVTPQNKPAENPLMVSFSFLDTQFSTPYPDNLHIELDGEIDFGKIAAYWDAISKKDYLYFVQELMRRKSEMQLNDWAYYALIRSIGIQISGGDQNECRLFTWFVLNQSGYKARVGYADNLVYLVVPSRSIIYSKTYYRFNNIPYFVLDAPDNVTLSLNVFEKDYPDAPNVLDLSIPKPLKISDNVAYRDIKLYYQGQNYTFKIAYSTSAIQLFENYPLTDISFFFKAPPSTLAAQSLKENLSPIIAGKSEVEAVRFLLFFVQKAFEYQTDQVQFNREKVFFIEETLYYPYSDCEDRSILFAYLVKELVGLKVIGLDYPGHITTAVLFNEDVTGHQCEYNGKKYLICDPTYIGADMGRAMDSYKDLQGKVIDLD
ncbi:MAG: hypothetical protein NW226_06085 [Microscillaceae bacterium]|nr:hypothetical protein [Microscillaceae bacterium]